MITFSSTRTLVNDGDYTFEDIYQASQDQNNNYCKKLGDSYLISNDLIVGDGTARTTLTGKNISVTIIGDIFQLSLNSTLYLGSINTNTKSTYDGVYISCPNIKMGYGFGNTSMTNGSTDSGDFYIYDSFVDIFGFWGFFGGSTQHCELVDCLINGYGRIEGQNSIIENVIIQKSHGRYGMLAPKGTIKSYKNVSSKQSYNYHGSSCSVYLNPTYSPNLRIIGGTFDGYASGLLYAEKNNTGITEAGYITFVDSEIKNGYGGKYSDSNTKMFVKYTFSPIFKNLDNNLLSNVEVTITNNLGEEIYSGYSDLYGKIEVELLKYWEDADNNGEYLYYDITATANDITVTRRYDAGVTYLDCPFYITNEGTGTSTNSGDCCLDDIQAKLDALQSAIETKINTSTTTIVNEINVNEEKIDNLSDNTNQMLISLGEEIDENQTIIESKSGNTRMFL